MIKYQVQKVLKYETTNGSTTVLRAQTVPTLLDPLQDVSVMLL